MNIQQYQELAHVTEAPVTEAVVARLAAKARLLHGAVGLATESGEFLDNLKSHIYYNKPFDETNAREEVGDFMWYVALLCNALGVSLEEVCQRNIAKLKARYGDKFTEHDALNRDLANERMVLEGTT